MTIPLRPILPARLALLALATSVAFALGCSGPGGDEDPGSDPEATETAQELDGAVLFQRNCAACHGTGGRGDGRVAAAFVMPPPDLTRVSASDGWFPEAIVQSIIDGRHAAHGRRGMPVWGSFLSEEQISAIVEHLEGLQR